MCLNVSNSDNSQMLTDGGKGVEQKQIAESTNFRVWGVPVQNSRVGRGASALQPSRPSGAGLSNVHSANLGLLCIWVSSLVLQGSRGHFEHCFCGANHSAHGEIWNPVSRVWRSTLTFHDECLMKCLEILLISAKWHLEMMWIAATTWDGTIPQLDTGIKSLRDRMLLLKSTEPCLLGEIWHFYYPSKYIEN